MSAHSTPARKPLVPVVIVTLATILLFVVITRLMTAWIPSGSNEEAERAALRAKNLADLQIANQEALETYGWANREAGAVRVPIEVAMKMVLPELNSRPPAPAYPIVAAPPEPVVDEVVASDETATEDSAQQEQPAEEPEPAAPDAETSEAAY